MPKPLYILCSESGSEDRTTGLVSFFNVLDQLELREPAKRPDGGPPVAGTLDFQVVALWARTSEDAPEQQFQFALSLSLPQHDKALDLGSGIFMFEKPRFRAMAFVRYLDIRAPGVMRAECRIKRLSDADESWLAQSYEVEITQVKVDPSSSRA